MKVHVNDIDRAISILIDLTTEPIDELDGRARDSIAHTIHVLNLIVESRAGA